jgi:diguanylate cyclase (GGDEF)-like protein
LRLGTERDIFQILHNLSVDVCERLLRQFIDAIHSVEKTTEIKKMNKMLKQIAHTDMLTGLLNRKGLEEELKRQFKADSGEKINSDLLKSKLKYNFYFVLYIDLDNFKYCNDTFGHDVGDAVLKAFASLLERLTSTNNGLAIRYGGDEFIVVFKNMDRNTVIKQIENIYQMLLNENSFVDVICEEMNELVNIEEKNRICCSVGVAGFKTIGNDGLGEFYKALENADKALYHVKKTKKGTYSFYTK